MRTIKLLQWLHRSAAAQSSMRPTYRLTIMSRGPMLNAIRKQLYYELRALDMPVLWVRVSRADAQHLACTSVMLECPHHLRPSLNTIAQRLGQSPDIRRIHVENASGSTTAVLPA